MAALMIYFLCVVGFFLLCSVIIIVAYVFSDYRPNEAQMKAMKEEYERKKEEKRRRKLAGRPKGHWEFNGGSLSSHWVPDKEPDLIDIGRY